MFLRRKGFYSKEFNNHGMQKIKKTKKVRNNKKISNGDNKKHEEDLLQENCILWMKEKYKGILYCGNHGGTCASSIVEAKWAKRRGYVAGSPDITIYQGNLYFHGLLIEMKTPTGTVRKNQKEFLDRARKRGYFVAVCRNIKEFKKVVNNYMKLPKKRKENLENKKRSEEKPEKKNKLKKNKVIIID